MRLIRIANKNNRTIKIVEARSIFDVMKIANKYEYWEYMR